MQVIINVPDTLPAVLIQQRVKQLEESLKKEAEQANKKTSKWEKMVQRIESKSFDLNNYTENFNQDRKEFRESFTFEDKTK